MKKKSIFYDLGVDSIKSRWSIIMLFLLFFTVLILNFPQTAYTEKDKKTPDKNPPTIVDFDVNTDNGDIFVDFKFSEPVVVKNKPKLLFNWPSMGNYLEYNNQLSDERLRFKLFVNGIYKNLGVKEIKTDSLFIDNVRKIVGKSGNNVAGKLNLPKSLVINLSQNDSEVKDNGKNQEIKDSDENYKDNYGRDNDSNSDNNNRRNDNNDKKYKDNYDSRNDNNKNDRVSKPMNTVDDKNNGEFQANSNNNDNSGNDNSSNSNNNNNNGNNNSNNNDNSGNNSNNDNNGNNNDNNNNGNNDNNKKGNDGNDNNNDNSKNNDTNNNNAENNSALEEKEQETETEKDNSKTEPIDSDVAKAKDEISDLLKQNLLVDEHVNKLIDGLNVLKKKLKEEKDKQLKKDILKKIKEITKAAAEKMGEETVNGEIEKEKIKAVITAEKVNEIMNKADNVVNNVYKLNGVVSDLETGAIKPEIAINVVSPEEKKELEVVLPKALLDSAKDKDIRKVKIKAKDVYMNLPVDVVQNGQDMVLSIKKETKNVVISDKLNENVEYKDHNVYDLNILNNNNKNKISSFEKPIEVSIPYEVAANQDPEKLTVCVYVEDVDHLENPNDLSKLYTWQPVGGKYDSDTKTMKFNRKSFSMYTIIQVNKSFNDLAKYEWARKEIELMAAKGIINGRSVSQFDPSANVTRAEFVAMVVRTLGIMDSSAKVEFRDVSPEAWYYRPVASAYKAGIISGDDKNMFYPNAPMTRQEMMKIIANAMEKVLEIEPTFDESILNSYIDKDSLATWAKQAAAFSIKEGIIKGKTSSTINPNDKVTRAETAVIVKRLYDLL